MQLDGALKAVRMLGADVGNLASNFALIRGQLDSAQEILGEINLETWGAPHPEEGGGMSGVQIPIGQYQAVLRLIDALS